MCPGALRQGRKADRLIFRRHPQGFLPVSPVRGEGAASAAPPSGSQRSGNGAGGGGSSAGRPRARPETERALGPVGVGRRCGRSPVGIGRSQGLDEGARQ